MQLPSEWLINILKVLLFRLQECFDPFCLVVCLRVLWNTAFETFIQPYFSEPVFPEIHLLRGSSFFSKCLKFNIDFKNPTKNLKKVFCFWDNSIWIVCLKLSIVRRSRFSLTVNVLANSLRILYISKRHFFQCNYLHSL